MIRLLVFGLFVGTVGHLLGIEWEVTSLIVSLLFKDLLIEKE